jgi:hypothetical protein
VRPARILALALLLFAVVSVAETMPHLGLPFEPRPVFMDCYRQAKWNGRVFVETGRTLCLAETQAP